MYDLIIKNGTVIDPSQGIEGPRDIAISQGKIAAIELRIPHKPKKSSMQLARGTGMHGGVMYLRGDVQSYGKEVDVVEFTAEDQRIFHGLLDELRVRVKMSAYDHVSIIETRS